VGLTYYPNESGNPSGNASREGSCARRTGAAVLRSEGSPDRKPPRHGAGLLHRAGFGWRSSRPPGPAPRELQPMFRDGRACRSLRGSFTLAAEETLEGLRAPDRRVAPWRMPWRSARSWSGVGHPDRLMTGFAVHSSGGLPCAIGSASTSSLVSHVGETHIRRGTAARPRFSSTPLVSNPRHACRG